MGALRLDQGARRCRKRRRQHARHRRQRWLCRSCYEWRLQRACHRRRRPGGRRRTGAATGRGRAAVRVPQVPGLRRVCGDAFAARADPRRGRAARSRRARQARPGRHTRDRIHRPGVPADTRRARRRIAGPPDAESAGAAAAKRAAPRSGGGRTGRRLRLPAPPRAPPAVPGRRPDPYAACRRRRSGPGRRGHGLRPTTRNSCTGWTRIASGCRAISTTCSPLRRRTSTPVRRCGTGNSMRRRPRSSSTRWVSPTPPPRARASPLRAPRRAMRNCPRPAASATTPCCRA